MKVGEGLSSELSRKSWPAYLNLVFKFYDKELKYIRQSSRFLFYFSSGLHNNKSEASKVAIGIKMTVDTDNLLASRQLKLSHCSIVGLRLQRNLSFLCRLLHNQRLHVVLLPSSYADLGNCVRAELQIARQLRAGAEDGRLSSVIEMQPNTVDSDADARADLGHDAALEVCRAEKLASTLLHLRELKVFALLGTLHIDFTARHLRALDGSRKLHIEVGFRHFPGLALLELHGRELGHFAEFVGLEASNLCVQPENRFKHFPSVVLLFVAALLQNLHRLSHVSVKVLKDIAGLLAIFRRSSGLRVNQRAQMRNAAVLFTGFVVSVALVANEVAVGAIILQMGLQSISSDLDRLARSTSHELLGASLSVSGLLEDFEGGASAAIGALNDPELALFEDVVGVLVVGDLLLLAGVVRAREGRTVEHGLLDGVQLVNGLHLLVAVFARGLLGVLLAQPADQLVALAAVARVDRDEPAVDAERGLGEHGVRPIIELLEAALDAGPVVFGGCSGSHL